MSQIAMYLYSNCSSCRNAEQVLKSAGVDYQRRDIFKERLSVDELNKLFRDNGKRPTEWLSRRSIPFRTLELANRDLSDEELIELMSEHPALLKRPIIIAPDSVQVGFNRGALEALAYRQRQG